MSKLIVVEGNMGIGKSTLCKELAEKLNYKVMDEPVGENPYLEKFYSDPKRYALEMQLWIMTRRFQMHREALNHISDTGQSVLMDRSIYGDGIFAKVHYQEGNIGDQAYETYLSIKNNLIASLKLPDVVVFLDAPVDVIHSRIVSRARDCESVVDRNYVSKIDKVYKQWLDTISSQPSSVVHVVDHSDFCSSSDIIKLTNLELFRK